MENKRQLILIAIAVLAGIAGAILIGNWKTEEIKQRTQELHDQYEQQQKQMAADLQQRSEQQIAALRQELTQVRDSQQQVVQQAMNAMKNTESKGTGASKKSTTLLSNKTPSGKRAVTVLVESLNAVGGLLNAGDYVDVIAHLDVPDQVTDKKKTVTTMLFQDLQVLAINTNMDDPGDYVVQQSAPMLKVTFAVDPQEAGLLAFANKNGKIELALRGANENDKQMVKASTWKTLADYLVENQGSAADELQADGSGNEKTENNKPYIQIFRGGKEL